MPNKEAVERECDMRTAGVYVNDVGDIIKWRLRTEVADSK